MLMSAVLTELIRSKRMEFYYRIILFLNALSFMAGLVFFIWTYNPVYMLMGMAFVGYLLFTRLLGIGDDDAFDLGGILSAIIGVLIVLGVATFVGRRTGAA